MQNLALLSASVVVCLVLGEAGLRIAGYRPFNSMKGRMGPWDRVPGSHTRVEPGGASNGPDFVLGYTYLPGRYFVTFDTGDSWITTHGADTLRITRPDGGARSGRPGVWIFGCSYVHGWGLNDDETLPWRVQTRLPQYDVANFGVGGYGDLQSLLQFRKFLERTRAPAVAVLAYAGFHDDRNIRSRLWRRWSYEYEYLGRMPMPYARLEGDALRFFFADQPYPGLAAIKTSALADLVDEASAQLDVVIHHGHRVSELLAEAFAREAAGRGVRFVLAGISREPGTESMLRYARQHGIPAVDISVDVTRPINRIRWDDHPSGAANEKSAADLATFLETLETTIPGSMREAPTTAHELAGVPFRPREVAR